MSPPTRRRRTTLWTLIDILQRRLERQGLSADVVDAAVTRALAQAMGAPQMAKA
jgi:hypothetical protein